MTQTGTDWRVVDGVATAWFDAPLPIEAEALAGRIVELPPQSVVDLRATGVRVRLDSDEHAEAVSTAARDLGLAANQTVPRHLNVVLESADPPVVRRFWQRRRLRTRAGRRLGGSVAARPPDTAAVERAAAAAEPHPPRRGAAAAVEQADPDEASGPYGVCHTDLDGNEVELVPGAAPGDRDGGSAGSAACSRLDRRRE